MHNKETENFILNKISDSLELYGGGKFDLTTTKEIYNCIKKFDFGLKDFSVFLNYVKKDKTPYGFAEYGNDLFLDSILAYAVYYKEKYVMDIGFSITAKREILISQIQAIKRKGNRFLYKIPNRIEFVLSLFFNYFPGFDIYLLNGEFYAKNELRIRYDELRKAKETLSEQIKRKNIQFEDMAKILDSEIQSYKLLVDKWELELKIFKKKTYDYIIDVYDSSLTDYKISKEELTYYNISYYKVVPK